MEYYSASTGKVRNLEDLIFQYDADLSYYIDGVFNMSRTYQEMAGKADKDALDIYQRYMRWFIEIRHWDFNHSLPRLSSFKLHKWGEVFDLFKENTGDELPYVSLKFWLLPSEVIEKRILPIEDPLDLLKKIKAESEVKISELLKLADENPELLTSAREAIYISKEQGLYRKTIAGTISYPIKGGRWKLISALRSGTKSGNILAEAIWGHGQLNQLSKDIREINKLFKKNLNVQNDFILHLKTNGYKLNEDDFELVWKD